MSEIQEEEDVVLDEKIEEEKIIAQPKNIPQTRSHESLWGAILFSCMLLFVIVSIVSIVWIAYSQWKSGRKANAEPSITILSEQAKKAQEEAATNDTKTAENVVVKRPDEQASASDVVSVKKMALTVLNGGATKGSAGTIATFLKTEGYTKVTVGNTQSNYTGIVIYYASGLDKEASIVKTSLIKKYPQAKTLPADGKNKETSVSQITIILGK